MSDLSGWGGYTRDSQGAATGGPPVGSSQGITPPPLTQSQIPNYYNNPAFSVLQDYYGPQQTALNNQNQSLQDRISGQGQYYSQASDAAQAQYASAMGLLGVDQRGNAIDQANIGKLLGLYDQQTGDYRSLYDAQNAQARAQAGQQTWDLNSRTTAQGGWGSEGQRTGLGTIDTLMNQAINANESQFSIAKNQNDISKQRLAAQQAQLQNQAGAYGLKADQLRSQLDAGLAKLGLDNLMSTGSLMDMLSGNDVQQATLARTIIDQALNTPQNVIDYLTANAPAYSGDNITQSKYGGPQ